MKVSYFVATLSITWLCAATAVGQAVTGPQGGSYFVDSMGDQITSVTNDDGSVVEYHYDSSGNEDGLTVSIGGVALNLQYSMNGDMAGFVQAGTLPPLICNYDVEGRIAGAALYPGLSIVNGEWLVDVDGPDPIHAASFAYGPGGHLASVTLNNGLSLQLSQPSAIGVVQQSVYGTNSTLLSTASPTSGTRGVRVLPAQLDAVATQLNLGANWAETLTFTLSASSHLTTARNADGEVVLYLVDSGPFRVGYTPAVQRFFTISLRHTAVATALTAMLPRPLKALRRRTSS